MQLYSDFGAADIAKAKIVGTFDNLELYEQREKLKIFIYSTEFCPQDLEVLIQLLIKYEHSYNQEMHQLTEFFFGTEIMRTCHLLDEPDIALKVFGKFFSIFVVERLLTDNQTKLTITYICVVFPRARVEMGVRTTGNI